MKKFLFPSVLLIGLGLFGCATTPENPELPLMTPTESNATIEKYSGSKKVYDGFQAVLEVGATLENSAVKSALLDKSARVYQWNTEQYAAEKNKLEAEKQRQSEVFVSFFVPDRKHDDLAKAGTKWKVFLDVNGRRLEGKVSKLKTILADVQMQFPYHTRWHTPYQIVFPLATTDLDGKPAVLMITGPVGSAKVEFTE